MRRTFWLSMLTLGCLGLGVWERLRWPSSTPTLDCGPEKVRVAKTDGVNVVRCVEGVADSLPPEGGKLLTVGGRLNLNRASADELTLVPGVGPLLAQALVKARDQSGAFRTWDEVLNVRGVGPTKLKSLQRWTVLEARESGGSR